MKKLFLLALPFLMGACSSNDDAPYVPVVPTPSDGVAYFHGTINGATIDYTYNYNSGSTAYGFYNGTSGVIGERYYHYAGTIGESVFGPSVTIGWENMYHDNIDSDESSAFYDTFSTIPTNYLTSDQDNNLHLKGVAVDYEDDMGNNYSTLAGSQAASTFTVTSSSQGIEDGGSLKVKTVIGTLNCKVYSWLDPTEYITISGNYKIIVREYN